LLLAYRLYIKIFLGRISVINESLLNEEGGGLEWATYLQFNSSWKDLESII
jgi:hypothetical protein